MTRILCDTHTYFWWVNGHQKLSTTAREVLEDLGNEILISAVVAWELATKSRLGKWPSAREVLDQIDRVVATKRLQTFPITLEHARVAGLFSVRHQDPFDRMLAAQAKVENMPLITVDSAFRQFDIEIIW